MSTPDKTLDLRGLAGTPLCCAVNEAIARHVLHREVDEDGFMRGDDDKLGDRTFESWRDIPLFSSSADAILPLLYKEHWEVNQTSSASAPIRVVIYSAGELGRGESNLFPLAACYALLRANGVTVLL